MLREGLANSCYFKDLSRNVLTKYLEVTQVGCRTVRISGYEGSGLGLWIGMM
jgi:hypothetical protein